jgi:tetratricopeptide (TPR) repeat protein
MPDDPDRDPDALYARRSEPGLAARAADLWAARLDANPRDYDAAWKLARASYFLGNEGPAADKRATLERGMQAAAAAAGLEPNRPEGHFWHAATMGALAESFGFRVGLRYRAPIKQALERVLAIDPSYQGWSADRALGRWYARVPRLFGGDRQKALEHFRRSIANNPESTVSHYFLAEALLDLGREADARAALAQVLRVPDDPEWGAEDARYKARAKALLASLPAPQRE